ncbi:complex I assembly factor ACAD9, mitochondrial [Euwallacea fornicatus]|uniref:complex I assembly factor ACAD9, mitochondrial n=1 Tax=Euwallacea fornicatus TaxID=995702 RepID=UPI00338D92C6
MLSSALRRIAAQSHTLKRCSQAVYSTAVEPLQKDSSEQQQDKEIKKYDRLSNIAHKTRAKKPQRAPFVKNFLSGTFDKQMLIFPELDLEEYRNLEKDINGLKQLLQENHMVNVDSLGEKKFRQNLVDHQAIGLQVSQFFGTRELWPMDLMPFLETISQHSLRQDLLHNDLLGTEILSRFAEDRIKKKYLPAIVSGESISALAMNEIGLTELNQMTTTAKLTDDGKHWILNGKKAYVVNGLSADILIVVAVSDSIVLAEGPANSISVFVVEKDTVGINCKKLEATGVELVNISFNNVQIPAENIIGPAHKADQILKPVMRDFRLSCGPACNAISKQLITNLHNFFVTMSTAEYDYLSTDAVRFRLGEILMEQYAIESVSYLTAGLQDWYDNQDVDVECAIVKIFSSEAALRVSTICLDSVGLPATMKNHWARKGHDDVINYLTLYETNENLRLFISLAGLQHVGTSLNDTVKKLRNPWSYGNFMLKRIWTNRHQHSDNPTLDLEIYDSLHPSCKTSSKHLEYCIKRLQYCTEIFLTKYGFECVNRHSHLRTLSNIIIDCYVMSAVLARASRSYCIGLQFADFELVLATTFCNRALERVRSNVQSIVDNEDSGVDKYLIAVGKRMIESKGYFLSSPLMRFF